MDKPNLAHGPINIATLLRSYEEGKLGGPMAITDENLAKLRAIFHSGDEEILRQEILEKVSALDTYNDADELQEIIVSMMIAKKLWNASYRDYFPNKNISSEKEAREFLLEKMISRMNQLMQCDVDANSTHEDQQAHLMQKHEELTIDDAEGDKIIEGISKISQGWGAAVPRARPGFRPPYNKPTLH